MQWQRDGTDMANDNIMEDLELITNAMGGDRQARQTIAEIAHPFINQQNRRLCKRYCRDNYRQYRCTIDSSRGVKAANAPLCEWGNAGYGWMLDYLVRDERLNQYKGRNGARLRTYFRHISRSFIFLDHWRNWRFERRVYVPKCITNLGKEAKRIFLRLYDGDAIPNIAQQLNLSVEVVEAGAREINMVLTAEHSLYRLQPLQKHSLCDDTEIASYDLDPEDRELFDRVVIELGNMDVLSRRVIKLRLIDGLSMQQVTETLKDQKCSVKQGVAPENMNTQQVFYFFRRALARLVAKCHEIPNR